MNGTNLFKIALRALANNKLRAFLTMLGIIIGVASVITMLAIGQGSKRSIQQQISEMGSNMSRQTGWCPARPFGHADVEADRL